MKKYRVRIKNSGITVDVVRYHELDGDNPYHPQYKGRCFHDESTCILYWESELVDIIELEEE